jgi:hypothetical protein
LIDVVVIGAGAAGLATAIFAARREAGLNVVALDGARALGAKILVSGGSRCNVTNVAVTAADFWLAASPFVRRVLRSFSVTQTVAFFAEIGVALHEEEYGKLFPDTNKARTVLEALLAEARKRGVELRAGERVLAVRRSNGGFELESSVGALQARRIVLATGGLSLPKTGSDGLGYRLAEALGHSLVPRSPALDPLLLDGGFHARVMGVAQPVEISVRRPGAKTLRIRGPLLWTHFGASGPAALDASRFWQRARLDGLSVTFAVNLLPGHDHATADQVLRGFAASRPRQSLENALATLVPGSIAAAVLVESGIDGRTELGQLRREDRKRIVSVLVERPLAVRGTRGYDFAEVTAGGVPLAEVDPGTMESRVCPGLYLVGEILDVDGRIGGFNFQWAWSTACAASRGLTARAPKPGRAGCGLAAG